MFDSPLEWCPVCNDWVAIDQSPGECARQHGCKPGSCPLAAMLRGSNREASRRAADLPAENGLELR